MEHYRKCLLKAAKNVQLIDKNDLELSTLQFRDDIVLELSKKREQGRYMIYSRSNW